MPATAFVVNGEGREAASPGETPLLYVLREEFGLKGTRFGCGAGGCGACTVLVDGAAVASCDLPVAAVAGKSVETVEALARDDHRLVRAARAFQAAQCGYCLPGILMAAKALLDRVPHPTRAEIVTALDGNLCRCGAHPRILRAIESAAGEAGP